jgi:ATP-dependent DNA helicase RecG
MIRETRNLEFKKDVTNTFLKTVSAFSNYDGGRSTRYSKVEIPDKV